MSKELRVKVGARWFTVIIDDPTVSPVTAKVDGVEIEVYLEDLIEEIQPDQIIQSSKTPLPDSKPVPDNEKGTKGPTKVFNTPMPGIIISVAVAVGDQVITGDEICVLEAMKMQQTLRADWSGIVRKVHVESGQQVLDGDPIVELE